MAQSPPALQIDPHSLCGIHHPCLPSLLQHFKAPTPSLVKSVKIANKIIKLVLFLFQRCPCSAVAMVTPASFSEFRTQSPPMASAACPHFLLLPTFHLAQAPPTLGCVPIQLHPCLGPTHHSPSASLTHPTLACFPVPFSQSSTAFPSPVHTSSSPHRTSSHPSLTLLSSTHGSTFCPGPFSCFSRPIRCLRGRSQTG